jgi:hypothetical protein
MDDDTNTEFIQALSGIGLALTIVSLLAFGDGHRQLALFTLGCSLLGFAFAVNCRWRNHL